MGKTAMCICFLLVPPIASRFIVVFHRISPPFSPLLILSLSIHSPIGLRSSARHVGSVERTSNRNLKCVCCNTTACMIAVGYAWHYAIALILATGLCLICDKGVLLWFYYWSLTSSSHPSATQPIQDCSGWKLFYRWYLLNKKHFRVLFEGWILTNT